MKYFIVSVVAIVVGLLGGNAIATSTGFMCAIGQGQVCMTKDPSTVGVARSLNYDMAAETGNMEKAWNAWLTKNGHRKVSVELVVVRPGYAAEIRTSDEPVTTLARNAFTFTNELGRAIIVIPEISATRMAAGDVYGQWTGVGSEMVVTTLLAHEFGHAVDATVRRSAVRTSKVAELRADCFAGNYIVTRHPTSLDLSAIRGFYSVVGDFDIHADDHHGTPSERMDAFDKGMNNPPSVCLSTYQY